jgi:antitoxin VapB
MAMNIKRPETEELARRVAELTGESLTDAITNALRERLQRLPERPPRELATRLMAIGRDCAAHLQAKPISADDLYDDRGLPK